MKTMKKMYESPVADILEMKTNNMLAASVFDGSQIDINSPLPGNADDGCAPALPPGIDIPGLDPLKMIMTLLLLVVMTLTANAQAVTTVEPAGPAPDGRTHGMKIYFKDNNHTTVEYPLETLSHVTYLPGIGMKVYFKDNPNASLDYLFSQIEKIEYAQDGNTNANWEKVGSTLWTNYPEAWRLEYPQVSYNNLSPSKDGAEEKNQIIVKRTDDYGITYSLEWDNQKVANRWTCYQLHEGNTLSSTERKDDFKADPEVAVSSTLADYNNSGFSRGHLCPSADRLCSEEQNKQTFYLTNMQPQYQSHNGGLWSRLETLVRDYATNDDFTALHCDTMYVVKAATISDVASDALTDNSTDGVYGEKCNDRLLVPKYFYMALLHYNKATDTYHAIAFWTKHLSTTQPVANLADYAISIDKLEQLTGIDFFCNLPDVIEEAVEAEAPNLDFWKKITKTE